MTAGMRSTLSRTLPPWPLLTNKGEEGAFPGTSVEDALLGDAECQRFLNGCRKGRGVPSREASGVFWIVNVEWPQLE